VGAVVPPPVVGELEVVLTRPEVEPAEEPLAEPPIAVDASVKAGQEVQIWHQPEFAYVVSGIFSVWVVSFQLEAADAAAEAEDGVAEGAQRDFPDRFAVLAQPTPSDAREKDDNILHG